MYDYEERICKVYVTKYNHVSQFRKTAKVFNKVHILHIFSSKGR